MMRPPNASLSTLCYIERDDAYLMLHRTKKAHDVNAGKWIGVGGHFEQDESPEECLLREVYEETGYTLTNWRMRGLVTFVIEGGTTEYMHLFTSDAFTGDFHETEEGELAWIEKRDIASLCLWRGDRIFLELLAKDAPFFLLKLCYDREGVLQTAMLNGAAMEV